MHTDPRSSPATASSVPWTDDPGAVGRCYIDQTHRLGLRGPAGAGYAGYGYRRVRSVYAHGSADHLARGLSTHGTVLQERLVGYPQDVLLGVVAVGDGAAEEER